MGEIEGAQVYEAAKRLHTSVGNFCSRQLRINDEIRHWLECDEDRIVAPFGRADRSKNDPITWIL
jgi:hypothetical protein